MLGKFESNWIGLKTCMTCSNIFIANSGTQKFCLKCNDKLLICLECGLIKKTIYHKFCSNSCAGKWKYRNSDKVKLAMKNGIEVARKFNTGRVSSQKGKPKFNFRGNKSSNWKGGISLTKRIIDMGRVEYKNWRQLVFKRDNHTCQKCKKRGGNLNADHILPYSLFPELRYFVKNGRTLCQACHIKMPTHGIQNVLREEFLIF